MKKASQDQMIKNLLRDYPVDALEFFKPEILQRYGRPVKIHFHIQEIKKHSHNDRNLKNDIAVSYTFQDGKRVILVLVEHWSDRAKFDIFRFAHYLIDLAYRFPGVEILPVALFTDRSERWIKRPPSEFRVSCLEETYLFFRYHIIRMKDHDAERYRQTKNRFIAVMRSAMKYELDKKIALAVEFIHNYGHIEKDIRNVEKNIEIIEFFLELQDEDKATIVEGLEEKPEVNMTIVQELKKRAYRDGLQQGRQHGFQQGRQEGLEKGIQKGIQKGLQKGLQKGIQQGIQQGITNKAMETALALLDENMPLEKIARVTGLSVRKVKALRKP
ncbi:MAG: Yae1 family protein [Spirochaetes bacterium]|nr:Yae1 family protein [Spirochaetota bacterium]